MYDWANSIYATNIMAAIYPTIFAAAHPNGDIMWGYGTSVATFLVAILAPFLGAIADHKGMKKKLFTAFALIGILFTPLMAFFGNLKLCLIGYVISRLGFSGSCLFYDSFLTDVTTDDRMDRVSSWGYAMGYIGGSTIPFIISIGMLLLFDYSHFAQVFSVLIVSCWWLVFSIPFLLNVKQEHYIEEKGAFNPAKIVKNVIGTFKEICGHKAILFFIIAYFFYIDGVDTVISISTAYGATLGLGTTGMILALLVTQIVAVPCSIIFARIAEKFSARKSLMGAVCVYVNIHIRLNTHGLLQQKILRINLFTQGS
ncbi:MAG: MFS transporter, partial [Clostridia bacterium]|nr:MFS transporter [Clostridia bacterium]